MSGGGYSCNALLSEEAYFFFAEFEDEEPDYFEEDGQRLAYDERKYTGFCGRCWQKNPGSATVDICRIMGL